MRPTLRPGFSRLVGPGVAGRPLRWTRGPTSGPSSLGSPDSLTGRRSFASRPDGPEAPQRARRLPSGKAFAGAAAVGSLVFAYLFLADDTDASRTARGLNGETFVPFVVVAREPVSATAVVLTLRPVPETPPAARAATRAALAAARQRRGTWAVEAKQPQLQIAREYTPLPVDADDEKDCTVRLFVRVVPGGEMSRYLVQRAVGETVSLRGPRPGFDVARRLGGGGERVVFLAAGTGIAPALQAADAVLGDATRTHQNTAVTILWANRRRQDSDGYDRVDTPTVASPIVRSLQAMQRQYGHDRLQVRCFVDEDQTFITEAAVQASLGTDKTDRDQTSWWPWRQRESSPPAQTRQSVAGKQDCSYHSAAVLEKLEADPDEEGKAVCSCVPSTGAAGQNLVMVSGPDGFVSYWAGPKRWAGGQERQGPVGGILGRLKKAGLLADWLVLKL